MGRLFWKLFTAYWLAFVVIIVAGFLGLSLYRQHLTHELFENSSRPEVVTVANTLRDDGVAAAQRLLKEMRSSGKSMRRLGLVIVSDNGAVSLSGRALGPRSRRHVEHALANPLIFPQKQVTSPAGESYHVISLREQDSGAQEQSVVSGRWLILTIATAVSLLLCFWLARYLSRPIKRLSRATRSYAAGNLNVRVAPHVGSRRDEVADLARDFDLMAGKLQQLIDGQQQLLTDVSHELRSPLARLQMAVGLARKRQQDSSLNNGELDRIERDVKRLGELVGQVLTLSRLETGVAPQHQQDLLDVSELLSTIIEDANYEAATKNCQVTLDADTEPTLMADGELLHQALENVIRNAVRYSAENTEVSVTVKPDTKPGLFIVTICDRGPGVAVDLLEKLFEPFVRGSAARERTSGDRGYGLGMAITKRAIEYHGGSVSAHNRDGGGLCVTVYLPHRGEALEE
ncbi:MAG: ATP-binding protein [Porticoccaceae bacterium]|nr:ATP-binding protein [Porticoccaceae bacterium]